MSSFRMTFLLHFTINHVDPRLKRWGCFFSILEQFSGGKKNLPTDVACLFGHLCIKCKCHDTAAHSEWWFFFVFAGKVKVKESLFEESWDLK